jgi:hypothetical protein
LEFVEVLLGLAGVVLGWVLAFATDFWRERVEARRAVALVLAELGENARTLGSIKSGNDFRRMEPIRHRAWDDHSLLLQRVVKGEPLADVYKAYALLDTLTHSVALLQQQLDEAVAAITEMALTGEPLNEEQRKFKERKAEEAKAVKGFLDDVAEMVRTRYLPAANEATQVLGHFRPFER